MHKCQCWSFGRKQDDDENDDHDDDYDDDDDDDCVDFYFVFRLCWFLPFFYFISATS